MSEPESITAQKEVAFYTATVEAWVNTRMEKDRTLLTLSTGGIGLLATLLTTVGPSSKCELLLYGIAGAFFVTAAVSGILVFNRNARYLREIVVKNKTGDDSMLV